MKRRDFIASAGAMAALSGVPSWAVGQKQKDLSSFPEKVLQGDSPYVEYLPIPEYHNAPTAAYETFQDMKFGARIHWGIYSIWHRGAESWPFLKMSFEDRHAYNQLYKTWNPAGFDASAWVSAFKETPFKRDVVKELCDEAHKQGIKIDLYFSHPDWYDADFRPYGQHPLQVPSSKDLMVPWDYQRV